MGVDVSSHDPLAIARGFGWTAQDVASPEELEAVLRQSFRSGRHIVRICVEKR
jgi:thiamine pyrophosphate-dependent acetolactate synthase large subunit-like protein